MSDLELRVENLNVGFGRRTVLRDISFTVHAGEFICLLGQNAAGKTTLFKAVSNLIASSGRVTLCENGKALPRSAIAYLPQLTQVQSRLTVFEMVMLGLGRRLSWRVTPDIFERVDQTLHAMQISHLADRPVASLSGGQKQLVFMAQAFVSRPSFSRRKSGRSQRFLSARSEPKVSAFKSAVCGFSFFQRHPC